MDNGSVKTSGTYSEIIHSGIDISQYIPAAPAPPEDDDGLHEETPGSVTDRKRTLSKHKNSEPAAEQEKSKANQNAGKLVTIEEKNDGNVSMATYKTYLGLGGYFTFFVIIMAQLTSQVLQICANFWLVTWGTETTLDLLHGERMSRHKNFFFLKGYAGMMMAGVACIFTSRVLIVTHRTRLSLLIHEKLLRRVMAGPISFFDITPIGRVINRFSQDLATVDEDLSQSVSQFTMTGGATIGCIGAIIGASKGTFLLLIMPLMMIYNAFQNFYRKSNTAIARIEAVTRSPIYADFSQVLAGTCTIRAYKGQDRYIKQLENYSNSNTIPGVYLQICSQWLTIRLDVIGSFIIFFMGVIAVATKDSGFIPAGYLALGLSYAIQLTTTMKMTVRLAATAEAQMNSVERINFYCNSIPAENERDVAAAAAASEPVLKDDNVKSPPDDLKQVELVERKVDFDNWLTNGKIEFRNVCMRYRDGPLVLNNVSFTIEPHTKIGICGRTGCGKSSLMVALFRIEELQSGQILIDGVDIASIPLLKLRSKLCIIPQDPVMFSSDVRFNLDPFNEFSEEEIWEVLQHVNMKDYVMNLPHKLQEVVAEGGENLSAGQRQVRNFNHCDMIMDIYVVSCIVDLYCKSVAAEAQDIGYGRSNCIY